MYIRVATFYAVKAVNNERTHILYVHTCCNSKFAQNVYAGFVHIVSVGTCQTTLSSVFAAYSCKPYAHCLDLRTLSRPNVVRMSRTFM